MPVNTILALDKSARQYDVDGRLFVQNSHITKATVSPYLGHEIPNFEVLRLDPAKIYNLLRDPVELANAAPTFAGLPILIRHKVASADDHPAELTCGATGTDVTFDSPYLDVSLNIWTAEAIAGIETKQQTEISCGYRYRADMTPGVFEGMPYDGVMRDIVGNHVALVEVGRAGPDVVVSDSKPLTLRDKAMSKIKLSRKAAAMNGALRAVLTPKLAQDAQLPSLAVLLKGVTAAQLAKDERHKLVAKILSHVKGKLATDAKPDEINLALDAGDDDDVAMDDDDEDDEDAKKKKLAKDAEGSDEPGDKPADAPAAKVADKDDKPAMDAATVTKMVADAVKANNDLHVARHDVAPIVGTVALDSAEAVYKFALDHLKVDTAGVHPSAYRAMVKLAQDAKPTARMANDAAIGAKAATVERFSGLSRFGVAS